MSISKTQIISMVAQGLITDDAGKILQDALTVDTTDNNYGIDLQDLTVIRVTENGINFKEAKSLLKVEVDTKIAEARKYWESLREHSEQLKKFRKSDLA